MSNLILKAIAGILAANIAPIKTALTTAETNPQEALSILNGLIPEEVGALPELENEAISAGSALALEELAKLEAKVTAWANPAPVTTTASPPASPAASSASGTAVAEKSSGDGKSS